MSLSIPRMNSSTTSAGLATHLPPTDWLSHGEDTPRLAFSSYPARKPWLYLLISHGYGEHRGWWHHVAEGLQAAGISTFTFDQFHHGVSEGKPGDVRDYGELVNGLELALTKGVLPQVPAGKPVALLGHSNGGLCALRALAGQSAGEKTLGAPWDRVSFLVLSNPLLGMRARLSKFGIPVARVLGMFLPGFMLPTPSFPPFLTSDRTHWKDYRRDPLRLQRGSAKYFLEMVDAAQLAFQRPSCGGLPLLLLWAGRDRVVNGQATLDWYERLENPSKTLVRYPKLNHELFQEPVWPELLESVVTWLRDQTKSAQKRPAGKTRRKATTR